MADDSQRRHSKPAEPELVDDPHRKAEKESLNALKQFDLGIQIIKSFVENGREFKLRPSVLLSLHREALQELSGYAGNYRPSGVLIEHSKHQPPHESRVPEYVEEFCDYINDNWETKSALHLAAYAMWRLNWIHPFADGNGRTSRIISYVVLCCKLGRVLPGTITIPDQIVQNRDPYFAALDAADRHYGDGKVIDVSEMENFLKELLGAQLYSVVEEADSD
jgi:Fic family protein